VQELTSRWPQGFVSVAIAAPLVLAGAALTANGTVGPTVAMGLLAAGCTITFGALLWLAGSRLRRAEDALRLWQHALETVPHAIFVVDSLRPGHPNRYVNPAYAALTGYGVAEAASNGFDALAIFVDPAEVAALGGELASGSTHRVTLRRRDGATAPVKLELRAAPRSDGGHYWIGLLEAVKVDKTTAAPQLDAPAAGPGGRATDAFLSSLSHDLRSPLNACVMWLDVLALAPQPDKLTQAVDAIRRNLARQTRLVNDLNDAAKISAGGLEVRLEPVDFVALLKRHIDTWQLLAIGKQLTLQHRIEPANAHIEADPSRLSQALNQLLENAMASTPAGGRVELRVRSSSDTCVVEIEDTGVGLSPEDAANLATPLWRSPSNFKTRPGLGLGLAVAHHLMHRQGGTLTATSRSSGALFTLTLPLAAAGGHGSDALAAVTRSSEP
jgi:signal transduction histidine kinase